MENKIIQEKKERKRFDPVEYGLNSEFRLTNYTKLKG
jgi:hypothetical protein